MSTTIAAVVSKMVDELSSLKTDEERERAFAAARAVLGMEPRPILPEPSPGGDDQAKSLLGGDTLTGVSNAGAAWIKRHGLTRHEVEEYFHIEDGKVTLIGDGIGSGKREQSINAYLLTGIAALLQAGKAEFTDKTARDYCSQLGCYDAANHSKTTEEFGNRVTGSKKAGWKLTAPGLAAAASILKPKAPIKK